MDTAAIKLLIDLQHEAYRNSLELFVGQVMSRVDSLQAKVVEQAKTIDLTRSELVEVRSLFRVILSNLCGGEGVAVLRKGVNAWDVDDRGGYEGWNLGGRGGVDAWVDGERNGCERRGNRKRTSRGWDVDRADVTRMPEQHLEEATLCVDGLEETETETDEDISTRLSTMLRERLGLGEIHLRYCRRMGQANENQSRTVVARFCRAQDRDVVLARAGELEGSGLTIYTAWHSTQPAYPLPREEPRHGKKRQRKRHSKGRHKKESGAKFATLEGHITPLGTPHDFNSSAASVATSDSTASFLDFESYTEDDDEEFLAGPDTVGLPFRCSAC